MIDSTPKSVPLSYVLLASSSYSGSTLLSYLLGKHPQIATTSDVSGTRRKGSMDTFACSCGRLMRECPFWREVVDEMRARGYANFELEDFRLGFDHTAPAWLGELRTRSLRWDALEQTRDRAFELFGSGRAMRRIAERNLAFAESVAKISGASTFVDASKERMRLRYMARYLDADLRVIHLVRDVRGVVDSTMRRAKRGLTELEAARRWASTNAAIGRGLASFAPDRQILMRYEDLCREPDESLRRLFGFMGVDPEASMQRHRADQHLLGNRMRLDGTEEVRLNEVWRDHLSNEAQQRILAQTQPVYDRLYPSSRTDAA
jgi:hypothetical protein